MDFDGRADRIAILGRQPIDIDKRYPVLLDDLRIHLSKIGTECRQ
jgi:hypothetical protein